jgi:hypothetical protein
MMPGTFKNVDHSGRVITGAVIDTYHAPTGSNDNIELLLTEIYKEVCAIKPEIRVNVPDIILPPLETPTISVPETNVTFKHESSPITVQLKAPIGLYVLNAVLSVIALATSIYAVFK